MGTHIATWVGLAILIAPLAGRLATGSEPSSSSGSDGKSAALIEGGAAEGKIDGSLFIKDYMVHTGAALFIAACLAPKTGTTTYASFSIAVLFSLAIYGWTLVAPMVMPDR